MPTADPRLVAAIRRYIPPEYQAAALATALVESGGRLEAVGDSGNSFGPYQMNRRGRLASSGYTTQQAMDPVLSTQAFWKEAGALARKYPGIDWADLMYRAQRPADRAGYLGKLREMLPQARSALGAPAGNREDLPATAPAPTRLSAGGMSFGLDPKLQRELMGYVNRSGASALGGGDFDPDMKQLMALTDRILGGIRRAPTAGGRTPLAAATPTGAGAPAVAMGPGGLVRPLSTPMGRSAFGVVDAEGAPSAAGTRYHGAVDWFAPGGSQVVSPIAGTVIEANRSRGNSGQVYGGTVKVKDATGRTFVFRHVDPSVQVGANVRAGAPIAGVSAWTGGSPHAHTEVWRQPTYQGGSGYRYENMIDPATVWGG
jgi:hypothetical protein